MEETHANKQRRESILSGNGNKKAAELHLLKLLLESRLSGMFRDGEGTKVDFSEFDDELQDYVKKMGVNFCSFQSQLHKDIEERLCLKPKAFEALPRTSECFHLDADLVLDIWAREEKDINLVYEGFYDDNGEIRVAEFGMLGDRQIPDKKDVMFYYRKMPHHASFCKYPDNEWRIRVKGEAGACFLAELKHRLDQYLIGRLRGKVINSELKEVSLKEYKISELVYSSVLGKQVDELITTFRNWYQGNRVKHWGYILIGRPGTGKTTIGGLIAQERPKDCTFFYCPAGEIGNINELFKWATLLSPAIVQIDDVDLISQDREDGEESPKEKFTSQLMENLDGLKADAKIFVLFTTNLPKKIERAIINRAGRVCGKIIFSNFKECLPGLVKRYRDEFELNLSDQIIEKTIKNLPEKVTDLTPDEARNICARLYLLYRNEKVGSEKLKYVISSVYDAFHNPEFDGSYLEKGRMRHKD